VGVRTRDKGNGGLHFKGWAAQYCYHKIKKKSELRLAKKKGKKRAKGKKGRKGGGRGGGGGGGCGAGGGITPVRHC